MILVGSKVLASGMDVLIIRIAPVNTFREITWWGVPTAGLIPVVFWPALLGWIRQRSSPKEATTR